MNIVEQVLLLTVRRADEQSWVELQLVKSSLISPQAVSEAAVKC
jgi:hypothetical protein